MHPNHNTTAVDALPPSEWFASYPVVEPDQGMVECEGYLEPITLDEYRRIEAFLVASRPANGLAAQYIEGVA